MAEIVWLASYPKSGNTWMRVLLTNYLSGRDEPADINRLASAAIASTRSLFDEWSGIEASALDDATIERLRPEVYRCMAREAEDTLYMKVHDAWCVTDRGEGLFPADVTKCVIYIVRNPLDMVASCSNHWGIPLDRAARRLCTTDHSLARSVGGITDQLRQRLGTWSRHVTGWVDESNLPVCVVRYEDLIRDTPRHFSKVVHFCGLCHDEKLVQKAVRFSEFAELRRQEAEKGFKERSILAPEGFFRKGAIGGWRSELSPELIRQIIEVNGDVMRRFGYLDDTNHPTQEQGR